MLASFPGALGNWGEALLPNYQERLGTRLAMCMHTYLGILRTDLATVFNIPSDTEHDSCLQCYWQITSADYRRQPCMQVRLALRTSILPHCCLIWTSRQNTNNACIQHVSGAAWQSTAIWMTMPRALLSMHLLQLEYNTRPYMVPCIQHPMLRLV